MPSPVFDKITQGILSNDQGLSAHVLHIASFLFIGTFAFLHDDKAAPVQVELAGDVALRRHYIATSCGTNRRHKERGLDTRPGLVASEVSQPDINGACCALVVELINNACGVDQA